MTMALTNRSPAPAESDPLRVLEDFVFMEARLMDTHRFEDWYALWTEDALYWLPCNEEDVDPARELSLIYEDRAAIGDRVKRLRGKFAHAQMPKSRVVRVVSNIELESADADQVTGTSCFVLGEVRLNRQTVWFGRNHHTLVRTPGGFRMKRKKVFMLNNDTPMANLTFLI